MADRLLKVAREPTTPFPQIACEHCKRVESGTVGGTFEELRERLRRLGWLCANAGKKGKVEIDVCPDCRGIL